MGANKIAAVKSIATHVVDDIVQTQLVECLNGNETRNSLGMRLTRPPGSASFLKLVLNCL